MKEPELKVSELFGPVLQGEGYYTGVPSFFLRLFGCNFRCKMFGLKPEEYQLAEKEVYSIIENLSLYNTLEELPQVKTGCDTPFAIYKEFSKFTKNYSVSELAEILNSKFISHTTNGKRRYHLVVTGGEPLLWQKRLINLFSLLDSRLCQYITFETNGTQVLTGDVITQLNSDLDRIFLFSCSPKLSCSGEPKINAFRPEALRSYNQVKNSILTLKFVVGETQDISEVQEFVKHYALEGIIIDDVFLMPEGSLPDERYLKNCQRVSTLCNYLGYRYSPRLQVEIWGNGAGT